MVRGEGESESGIAIVAALWAATILAIMTLSVMQIVRADARVGRGRGDVAELSAVADAGVNIAILSLLSPRASQPPVNGVPFTIPFAGYSVRVSVQDEAGKIDLNMVNAARAARRCRNGDRACDRRGEQNFSPARRHA